MARTVLGYLLLAGLLVASPMALAQADVRVVRFEVPANQTTEVDFRAAWTSEDCSTDPITTVLTDAPDNGTVEFRRENGIIGPSPGNPTPNQEAGFGDCLGREILQTKVIYTPNKAFLGTDTFTYEARYESDLVLEFTTIVTVVKAKASP